MRLLELEIKNFGKFFKQTIRFGEGVQIFYGSNEMGKSTVCACIRAMLFGMERGRGRAAKNDEYSLRKPWENPGSFAGVLRFESGGKIFRLERDFGEKESSLVCETDGEELSLANGDLTALLEGIQESAYDNTFFISQRGAATEEKLAQELQRYMGNMEHAKDAGIDVARAVLALGAKKRKVEEERKKEQAKIEGIAKEVRVKLSYVQQETKRLHQEEESRRDKIRQWRASAKERQSFDAGEEEGGEENTNRRRSLWIFFLGLSALCGCIFLPVAWMKGVAGVLAAVGLSFAFFKREDAKEREETGRQTQEADRETRQSMSLMREEEKWRGHLEHIQSELLEKQTMEENLKERLEELEEEKRREGNASKEIAALQLAANVLQEASRDVYRQCEGRLNRRVSEILCEITEGRYTRVFLDDSLHMRIHTPEKVLEIRQVSRGTMEQIYFALRMAAGEILTEGEAFPVILDEAFSMYDDKRLAQTLRWLERNKKQTLVFTCQQRESRILEGIREGYAIDYGMPETL